MLRSRQIFRFFFACGVMLFTIGSCQPKYNENFEFSKSSTTPIVDFTINGVWASFLVDTGAEVSLLSPKFFNRNGDIFEISDTVRFTSITANGIDTLETYNTKVFINDTIPVTMRIGEMGSAISEMSQKSGKKVVGILGYDFIKANNIIFDFGEEKLTNFNNER